MAQLHAQNIISRGISRNIMMRLDGFSSLHKLLDLAKGIIK